MVMLDGVFFCCFCGKIYHKQTVKNIFLKKMYICSPIVK